ncbi:MAG: DUF1329 domain-containing protein [Rudaea sp.]|uniref:DUF1329 domain-containing protein n=1 Tax=Rudaea sp. TaxID=2136325 RepID=UPI0039E4B410
MKLELKIPAATKIRLLACLLAAPLLAQATSPADVANLGKTLTPSGAEKAGNADGSIPEWTGGMTSPPAGWTKEKGYVSPFPDEKPLFTITAQNLDQYKDKVSAGLQALLKKNPNLSMPVYKTHRTFANPQSVYDATKAEAANVKLDGLSIKGYTEPGVPFPVPSNGVEEMYNHTLRYFGSYKECEDWLPVRANGDFYKVGFCEDIAQDAVFDEKQPNHLFSFYGGYDAPATLVGTIYLVHDPIDQTLGGRQAWIYNAGQRRVRRAPDLAYDGTNDGYEGMRVVDDYFGFNGAFDRYDWKLAGKKEMYIRYNEYSTFDHSLKYKDMIDKGSLKSNLMRYELHRVWVVEATLKPGMSHICAKKTFYLDEDSHEVALSDCYDGHGALWRTQSLALVEAYDAKAMLQLVGIVHDVLNGQYHVIGVHNERNELYEWNTPHKWADFQVDAIRRRGVR